MDNVHASPIILTEPVILVRINTLIILVAMIVNASQHTQRTTLMFAERKMANAPAMKNMMVEPAIVVRMDIMVFPTVMIVDALQVTP